MSEQLENGLALAMKLFAGLESSGPPLPDEFQKHTFEHLF